MSEQGGPAEPGGAVGTGGEVEGAPADGAPEGGAGVGIADGQASGTPAESAAARLGWLLFWLGPQELSRYPIEIYGYGRAVVGLGVLAAVAVLVEGLDRAAPPLAARRRRLGRHPAVRVGASLLAVALVTPAVGYLVWWFAYSRLVPAVAVGGGVAARVALARRGRPVPWVACLVAAVWVGYAHVMLIRMPPSASSCPAGDPAAGLVSLVSRAELDAVPDLRGTNPFDVRAVPGTDRVVASMQSAFWRTEGAGAVLSWRPGTAGAGGGDDGLQVARLPADRACTRYPDKLAVDEAGRWLYVLTGGGGTYCLARFDLDGGLRFDRLVEVGGETKWIEVRGDRVYVLYWPAVGERLFHDVVLEVFDAASLEVVGTVRRPGGRRVGEPVLDRERGRLLAPSLGGPFLELDLAADPDRPPLAESPLPVTFAFGLAVDPTDGLRFLASPVGWSVVAVDGQGTTLADRDVGGTPVSLAHDSARDALGVARFAAGRLDVLAGDTLEPIGSYRVGRLARALRADPGRDRWLLATGCGLYAIDLDSLRRSGGHG